MLRIQKPRAKKPFLCRVCSTTDETKFTSNLKSYCSECRSIESKLIRNTAMITDPKVIEFCRKTNYPIPKEDKDDEDEDKDDEEDEDKMELDKINDQFNQLSETVDGYDETIIKITERLTGVDRKIDDFSDGVLTIHTITTNLESRIKRLEDTNAKLLNIINEMKTEKDKNKQVMIDLMRKMIDEKMESKPVDVIMIEKEICTAPSPKSSTVIPNNITSLTSSPIPNKPILLTRKIQPLKPIAPKLFNHSKNTV